MTLQSSGSISIALVAAVLMAGGVVADRLGATAELSSALVALVAGGSLTAAGLSARTMRPSVYYAGGRSLPSLTGSGQVLAVLFSLAVIGSGPAALPGAPALVTLAAGALVYAFCAAPAMRLAGGLTFAESMQGRFSSRLVSAAAALCAFCLCGGLALVLGPATVQAMQAAGGLGAVAAVSMVVALASITLFTGGMAGLVAASASATVLLAVGWGIPLGPLLLTGQPQRAEWLAAVVTAFETVEVTPASLGMALSAAGVLTVLNFAAAASNAAAARRAGLFAIAAMLVAGTAGLMAHAALDQRTSRLSGLSVRAMPAAIYSDAFKGQIRICGVEPTTPDDLQRICERAGLAGSLPAAAITIADARSGRWFSAIMDLPPVVGAAFRLAVPFMLLAAFAAACHGAAAALNHDILRWLVFQRSTTSGALIVQRLTALAFIGVAALGPWPTLEVDGRIARLLLFAAAAVPLPLVILGMMPGADWRAALCGLASALLAGTGVWFGYLEGGLLFVAGAMASLVAGVTAALLFPSRDTCDRMAADVFRGKSTLPLVIDRSA